MDNKDVQNPEDIAADEAALKLPTEEEIRSKFVEEFGFDETDDAERLDKLVKKDLEDRKRLSKTIGQKAKLREDLKKIATQAKEPPAVSPDNSGDLTSRDMFVLVNAGVKEEEDVEEVTEYARFKKISISEAIKSPLIRASLAEKAEMRKTAQATNSGSSQRTAAKISEEQLIAKANKGEEVDPSKLAEARMKLKKGK